MVGHTCTLAMAYSTRSTPIPRARAASRRDDQLLLSGRRSRRAGHHSRVRSSTGAGDKLFFYTAYEYMKQQPAGNLQNYFVPTDEMKRELQPGVHCMPRTGFRERAQRRQQWRRVANATSNGCSIQFPGGMIPKSQIDPNSLAYMSLFPKPNTNPADELDRRQLPVLRRSSAEPLGIPHPRRLQHQPEHEAVRELESPGGADDPSPISIWWRIAGSSLPYPSVAGRRPRNPTSTAPTWCTSSAPR